MKKILFVLIAGAMALAGCGGSNNSDPVAVANDFTKTYFTDYNLEEYVKFLEPEYSESLLASYQNPEFKEYSEKQSQACKALKFEVILNKEESIVNEASASIYFHVKSEANPKYNQKNVRVDLRKNLDGKWFVKYYAFPTKFDYVY